MLPPARRLGSVVGAGPLSWDRGCSALRVVSAGGVLGVHFVAALLAAARTWSTQPLRSGQRVTDAVGAVGGLLPKFAQLMGTRPDVFPGWACDALRVLQHSVPARPGEEILRQLNSDGLGRQFIDLDFEPLGSATVAQVHRATVRNTGLPVALKVVRPGLRELAAADCAILRWGTALAARAPQLRSVPLVDAVGSAEATLLRQFDMLAEARALASLRSALEGAAATAPRPHLELCRSDVLCMDHLDGVPWTTARLGLSKFQRERLMADLVRSVFKLIFIDGTVHCDLHPGNLLVLASNRVAVCDAGMVVVLPARERRQFARFFAAMVLGDAEGALSVVLDVAKDYPPSIDHSALRRDLEKCLHRSQGSEVGSFRIAAFIASLFALLRRHRVALSNSFTMPIVSLMVLEGTLIAEVPEMDFQSVAFPYVAAGLSNEERGASWPV